MEYIRSTVPTERRVTLDEAKEQLYVLSSSQDSYITGLIAVAEDAIMSRTNHAFFPTTYVGVEYNFCDTELRLPVYPVTAITSLEVKGSVEDATYNTLVEGTDFELSNNCIIFNNPDSYYEVKATFVAGHTDTTFPLALKGAVLMFIGTLFANRQSEQGNVVEKIPYGIEFMIDPHTYWYL